MPVHHLRNDAQELQLTFRLLALETSILASHLLVGKQRSSRTWADQADISLKPIEDL